MIPQADPGRSFRSRREEILAAAQRVLESGWYILGGETRSFEEAFARYNGCRHCLGVANGTDAIELVLRALKIGRGDKVATVGNTATATVSAIERTGAEVRFADIEPGRFTLSAASLEELLTRESGIRAVVAVHLFGAAADLDGILRVTKNFGIPLIEDCAQAHGAEYRGKKCGTFGIAGCFSFYPTKNLGAFGDGGAVITDDDELYETMTALRQYGWRKRYISEFSGINSRLDELQAAILSVKLPRLDDDNAARRKIAECFRSGLAGLDGIVTPAEPEKTRHIYHQFVLRVTGGARDALMEHLKRRGVGCAIHYPEPIPLQPGYRAIPRPCPLEETFRVNPEILSLPMYPELDGGEVETVIRSVRGFFR